MKKGVLPWLRNPPNISPGVFVYLHQGAATQKWQGHFRGLRSRMFVEVSHFLRRKGIHSHRLNYMVQYLRFRFLNWPCSKNYYFFVTNPYFWVDLSWFIWIRKYWNGHVNVMSQVDAFAHCGWFILSWLLAFWRSRLHACLRYRHNFGTGSTDVKFAVTQTEVRMKNTYHSKFGPFWTLVYMTQNKPEQNRKRRKHKTFRLGVVIFIIPWFQK